MSSGYFSHLELSIWLVCGSVRIKEQTSQRHMFKREWNMSSNSTNYSTLNSEHDWKDLCTQEGVNKHALLITITKLRKSDFANASS